MPSLGNLILIIITLVLTSSMADKTDGVTDVQTLTAHAIYCKGGVAFGTSTRFPVILSNH